MSSNNLSYHLCIGVNGIRIRTYPRLVCSLCKPQEGFDLQPLEKEEVSRYNDLIEKYAFSSSKHTTYNIGERYGHN